MKLKTLKDLYYQEDGIYKKTIDKWIWKRYIQPDDLRQAAEEWIKELKKNFEKRFGRKGLNELKRILDSRDITYCKILSEKATYVKPEYIDVATKIGWIKHFFNLDEE